MVRHRAACETQRSKAWPRLGAVATGNAHSQQVPEAGMRSRTAHGGQGLPSAPRCPGSPGPSLLLDSVFR